MPNYYSLKKMIKRPNVKKIDPHLRGTTVTNVTNRLIICMQNIHKLHAKNIN